METHASSCVDYHDCQACRDYAQELDEVGRYAFYARVNAAAWDEFARCMIDNGIDPNKLDTVEVCPA